MMNANDQFKDFVQRHQRPALAENAVDWGKEREQWLTYLKQLYDCVDEYLKEYVAPGQVRVERSPMELNEENIGTYTATRLKIVIGDEDITLTPIGTLLIGAKGRVDVEGSAGTSRLVLIDKNATDASSMFRVKVTAIPLRRGLRSSVPMEPTPPGPRKIEWTWKIVSRPPVMQFIELNKESFFQMLMEVSNG
jgi:hypothetical protein